MSFEEGLKEICEKFTRALNSGDAAGCAEVYAEDAVAYFRAAEATRGRDAIKRRYSDVITQGLRLNTLEIVRSDHDGAIGYAIQDYKTTSGSGMVMFAMRKNNAGKWEVTAEAFIAP